jgi:hypothetical protein
VALIIDRDGAIQDVLAADVPPITRPAIAAARSEATADAGVRVAPAPVAVSGGGGVAAALARALRDRLAAPGRPS